MTFPRTLKNQLVQSGLLPKSVSGVKSFADLSSALIRKNKKAGNLISIDPDPDPSAQTYEKLFQQFLAAAGTSPVTDLTVAHDIGKDVFSVYWTKMGKTEEFTWEQATSTVPAEFIDCVERLVNGEKGRLLRLEQEDALTYLYLDSTQAHAIEEWRDAPGIERWSFWENIPHWIQYLENEHPILPLETYRRVQAKFAQDFLNAGNDPRVASDYVKACVSLPYLTNSGIEDIDDDFPDGLGDWLEVDHGYYPGLENWVPDQSCYVILLDSPLNIIFEATPAEAEKIRGEMSGYKNLLYLDRDFEWAICLHHENRLDGAYTPANNMLTASGDDLLTKVKERVRFHGKAG